MKPNETCRLLDEGEELLPGDFDIQSQTFLPNEEVPLTSEDCVYNRVFLRRVPKTTGADKILSKKIVAQRMKMDSVRENLFQILRTANNMASDPKGAFNYLFDQVSKQRKFLK